MEKMFSILYLLVPVTLTAMGVTEAQYSLEKGCRNHPADIVFVLDESGSIWGPHFQEQLRFVNSVVESFDVAEGKTHVGVETFASDVRIHFNLGELTSSGSLRDAVNGIVQRRGATETAMALERMRTEMFSDAHARRGVPHVAIVITDGESEDPVATAIEAGMVHEAGITVFAIGVGVMNDDELHSIASSEELVFTVESYEALKKLKDILAWEACKATTPKPITTTLPQYTQKCRPADVIFSVPDDAGIRDTNTALAFIQSFLDDLDIGPEAVRMGVTPRLCDDKNPISLNAHDTRSGYKRSLRARQLTSSRISRQVEHLYIGLEGEGELVRNAAKIAILIVDNVSSDPDLAVDMAEEARHQGVRLVVIGIGERVNEKELSELASGFDDWYHVASYSHLPTIYDHILSVICRHW